MPAVQGLAQSAGYIDSHGTADKGIWASRGGLMQWNVAGISNPRGFWFNGQGHCPNFIIGPSGKCKPKKQHQNDSQSKRELTDLLKSRHVAFSDGPRNDVTKPATRR